jgi:hypothetical protein
MFFLAQESGHRLAEFMLLPGTSALSVGADNMLGLARTAILVVLLGYNCLSLADSPAAKTGPAHFERGASLIGIRCSP